MSDEFTNEGPEGPEVHTLPIAPPTTRAAFAAGMRYALELAADDMSYLDHGRAILAVDRVTEHLGKTDWAPIMGERFCLDDDSQNGGYYRAHPEHQRPERCSDCGRSGPASRRISPHMGLCGTCGRDPVEHQRPKA